MILAGLAGLAGVWALAPCARAQAAPGAAGPPAVQLIGIEPVLERAVTVALEPWGLSVRSLGASTPGAEMPAAAQQARELLARHGGDALVWLSGDAGERSLWLYDARQQQAFTQPAVVDVPLDEPAAAALALSIKALLRHSHVAPAQQRFGAASGVPGAGKPEQPASPAQRAFYLGTSAGVRLREVVPMSAEPRLGVRFSYLRRTGGAWVGALGEASFGLGVDVREPLLDARLSSASFLLGLVARWPVGPLDLGFITSGSVRHVALNGAVEDPAQAVAATRVNPTLGLWLTTGAELGAFRLGARAGVDASLRTQSYLVDGAAALRLSPVAVEIAVVLETRFGS